MYQDIPHAVRNGNQALQNSVPFDKGNILWGSNFCEIYTEIVCYKIDIFVYWIKTQVIIPNCLRRWIVFDQ